MVVHEDRSDQFIDRFVPRDFELETAVKVYRGTEKWMEGRLCRAIPWGGGV